VFFRLYKGLLQKSNKKQRDDEMAKDDSKRNWLFLYMKLCGRQGAQDINDHCIDAGQGKNKINSVAGLGNKSMTLISEGMQDLWLSRFFFGFFRCG